MGGLETVCSTACCRASRVPPHGWFRKILGLFAPSLLLVFHHMGGLENTWYQIIKFLKVFHHMGGLEIRS